MERTVILTSLVLFTVFILPFTSGQIQTLGTYTANNDINLTQTCGTCTYVNLQQVKLPDNNGEIFIDTNMTKQGSTFYYTFSNTSFLGQYIVTTCGDVNNAYECAVYDFYVTSNGQIFESSQALAILPLMGMAALLFFIGWSFSPAKWKLKSFFFATALLICIVTINVMTIMFGTSSSLQLMGQTALVIGIAIFSFYVLFLLVFYTKDVMQQVKDARAARRSEKSDPY